MRNLLSFLFLSALFAFSQAQMSPMVHSIDHPNMIEGENREKRITTLEAAHEIINLPYTWRGRCPENLTYVNVYKDDFNGTQLDHDIWTVEQGHSISAIGTGEFNQEANLEFPANSGVMRIVAKHEPVTGLFMNWLPPTMIFTRPDGTTVTNIHEFEFSSSAIFSNYNFKQGMFEINAKMPSGFDNWPAFWMFSHCADEIDILEFLKHNRGNIGDGRWNENDQRRCENVTREEEENANEIISMSVHKKLARCEDPGFENVDTRNYNFHFDFSKAFHKIAMKWDDFTIKFYVDDQLTRTFYHYYARVPFIFQTGLLNAFGIGGFNSYDRTFGNGGNFYLGIENCTELDRAWKFDQNEHEVRYFSDPQFAENLSSVIIQNAIYSRLCDPDGEAAFPDAFELDHFKLFDGMDCGKTLFLTERSDFNGINHNKNMWQENGNSTFTAGTIVVATGQEGFAFVEENIWAPTHGGFAILTASDEIIFAPPVNPDSAFDVPLTGNLIAQIRPCKSELEFDPLAAQEDYGHQNFSEEEEDFSNGKTKGTLFRIFPNPFENCFGIIHSQQGDQVCLFDFTGKMVWSGRLGAGREICANNLVPGVYAVQLFRNSEVIFAGKAVCLP